jgi:hypothetical protein
MTHIPLTLPSLQLHIALAQPTQSQAPGEVQRFAGETEILICDKRETLDEIIQQQQKLNPLRPYFHPTLEPLSIAEWMLFPDDPSYRPLSWGRDQGRREEDQRVGCEMGEGSPCCHTCAHCVLLLFHPRSAWMIAWTP